jgi:hypothetical protein
MGDGYLSELQLDLLSFDLSTIEPKSPSRMQ